ncbi:MAG: TetR/AcrR family transcriptional regulator [Polyangiaceae bacterium]
MARPRSDISTRILHAARARFASSGVDAAALRTIAADAGTSIGMVYYYYPSKDDLFFAVVEEVYATLLAELGEALEAGASFEERMRRLYRRIGAMSEVELTTALLIAREAMTSSPRLARLVDRFRRGHLALVLAALGDGVREGAVDGRLHPALGMMVVLALAGPPQLIRRAAAGRLPLAGMPEGAAFSDLLVSVLMRAIAPGLAPSLAGAPASSTGRAAPAAETTAAPAPKRRGSPQPAPPSGRPRSRARSSR